MFKNVQMKKIILWLFVVMIASFIIAGSIFLQTGGVDQFTLGGSDHKVDESAAFTAAGLNAINIDCRSADIRLIPVDGNDIKVHFFGNTNFKKNGKYPQMDAKLSGNQLNIQVEQLTTIGISFTFNKELILEVSVPKTYFNDIKAHTSSGNVTVTGFNLNNLDCSSSSGDIRANQITAKDLTLNATSGNVTIQETNADRVHSKLTSGDLRAEGLMTQTSDFKNLSGNIKISKFSGDLKADSSSGDIKIEYRNFNNGLEAQASSGNITLLLPENAEFYLDARASSGEVHNDFPITITGDKGEHKLEGTVVSDAHQVRLHASSGDISIRKQ